MTEIVLAWAGFKDVLAGGLGLTHHDLHLLLGVLLTIGIGWLLRLPLGSWLPLLAVLALETANEVSDFTRFQMAGWPWSASATLVDVALTMVPPLALVLAARWQSPEFYRFRKRTTEPAEPVDA